MQVEVHVKYMQTNFCGRGLSTFGDFGSFCSPLILPIFKIGSANSKSCPKNIERYIKIEKKICNFMV